MLSCIEFVTGFIDDVQHSDYFKNLETYLKPNLSKMFKGLKMKASYADLIDFLEQPNQDKKFDGAGL